MADVTLTPELLARIEGIDVANLQPGATVRMPDFLLVGPQRTGTTWMAYHLGRHPEVYIPPEKELYFFSGLGQHDDPHHGSDRLSWYSEKLTPTRRHLIRKALHGLATLRVFRPVRRVGEASATYAVMSAELIRNIFALNPDVTVVITLRDPVDRAWSHARLEFKARGWTDPTAVPFREFEAFYQSDLLRRSSDYAAIIRRWKALARPGHVHVMQFSKLEQHPQAFLHDLMAFVGLTWFDRRFFFTPSVALRIGATQGRTVPEQHRAYLETLLHDEIRAARYTDHQAP